MSKEAEEILREHFIPNVCSKEYFNHCIENNNLVTAPPQAIKAMDTFAHQSTLSVLESLKSEVRERQEHYENQDVNDPRADHHTEWTELDAILDLIDNKIKDMSK